MGQLSQALHKCLGDPKDPLRVQALGLGGLEEYGGRASESGFFLQAAARLFAIDCLQGFNRNQYSDAWRHTAESYHISSFVQVDTLLRAGCVV